jgi:hypothetical protein
LLAALAGRIYEDPPQQNAFPLGRQLPPTVSDLPPGFLGQLKSFAAGVSSVETLAHAIGDELKAGPQFVMYEGAEPDAIFTPTFRAAMALDVALDKNIGCGVPESRRLAGTLASLLESSSPSDPLFDDLFDLACVKEDTVTRIRQHLGGTVDRDGFHRFLQRRPWSTELMASIAELDDWQLATFAERLDDEDWNSVRGFLAAA